MPIDTSKKSNVYALMENSQVVEEFDSSLHGLSEEESRKRLQKFGKNLLVEKKEVNVVLKFLSLFLNPLIMVLLIAAIFSLFFGEKVDAVIIIAIILISVTLDFVQSYSSEKAVKGLKEKVKSTAMVLRGNKSEETDTTCIVPGDIIVLTAGNVVPADARVIESKNFFVDQSTITGESFPAEKFAQVIKSGKDLSNIIYSGTSVVGGSALALVLKTGASTELGKIAAELAQPAEKSEFEQGIASFGFFIMKITIFMVLFIFLYYALVRHHVLESFMFAVAIAVGVTPELLPMILSVMMTKGSLNMAKKGVITKNLAAIPNFGSMEVLCTDKTGTLTENRIKLITYSDIAGNHSEDVLKFTYVNSFFQTGVKNPLDDAVLRFKKLSVSWKKMDEIPFDFIRRRISVIVAKKGKTLLVTKGAPEEVLSCCKFFKSKNKRCSLNKKSRILAMKQYRELSASGYRVLAVAIRTLKKKKKAYSKSEEKDLEFLGFVSFLDPPKKGVKSVVKEIQMMGIEIKIITGDNELVTKKICSEIGLEVKGILLGDDLHNLTDDALKKKVRDSTIFARFSPDQKTRVIQALRANKLVVGFMGDGVNDAPSLKAADVGISVSNATDVAKGTADLVLTKKSLKVLKEGIIEGRKTFGNTIKYIMFTLSSNFGNMFSAAGSIMFLPFLPMLPIQILLNNLMYDFSQITIPSDNVDEEWVKKPRKWNLKFIKRFMYIFGPISSLFDYLTFFILFWGFQAAAPVFQTGWFIECLATQTLVIHVIRTRKTAFLQSWPSKLLLLSTISVVALGWMLPFTSLGRFFKFQPLPWPVMIVLAGIVVGYLITVEIAKKIFYKMYDF